MRRFLISAALLATLSGCGGCRRESRTSSPPDLPAADVPPPTAIVAQGTLQPRRGILNITAQPGDEIDSIEVQEKDRVEKGQVLAVLSSLESRQLEQELAETRVEEARQRIEAERVLAESKLKSAKLAASEAELKSQDVEAKKSELELLRVRLKQATEKLQRLKELREQPLTRDVTSQEDVDQQQLLVDTLNSNITQGEQALEAARQSHELALEAAAAQIEAAQHSLDNIEKLSPIGALQRTARLAQLGTDQSTIKSPIDGVVLRVLANDHDRVTQAPLMQLAKLEEMVCVTEVYEASLQHVELGQRATISSPALREELTGRVLSKGMVIGRPSLPDPNPLSRQDVRTAEVVVLLDEGRSTELAAEYINLQVNVRIPLEATADDNDEPEANRAEASEPEEPQASRPEAEEPSGSDSSDATSADGEPDPDTPDTPDTDTPDTPGDDAPAEETAPEPPTAPLDTDPGAAEPTPAKATDADSDRS